MDTIEQHVFPFLHQPELLNVLRDDTNREWRKAIWNILSEFDIDNSVITLMQALIDKAIRERNYAQVNRCKMLFIRFESILTKQIKSLLELALSCPDETSLGWVFRHFPAYRLSDSRWVLEHAVKRGKSIDLILALDRACC